MASFKITDLTELTGGSVADTDVLEIVDLDADQSKKVTIASLKTVFSASEGSSYTGGTSNGIMFNDGDTFATSSNFVFDGTNVGIGTTSPDTILHALGGVTDGIGGTRVLELEASLPSLWFKDTNGGGSGLSLNKYGNTFYFSNTNSSGAHQNYAGQIQLSTGRWTIGSGNNPLGQLDVKIQSAASIGQLINLANGQTADAFQINSFGNTGGDLLYITSSGKFVNADIIRTSYDGTKTTPAIQIGDSEVGLNGLGYDSANGIRIITGGVESQILNKSQIVFKYWAGGASPAVSIYATDAVGATNGRGSSLVLSGGRSSGNANGGDIIFKSSLSGVSGTSLNSLVEVARITNSGSVGIGATSPSAKLHTSLSTDVVGHRLDLSNGQTEDAFQINSFGNTGGDIFNVEAGGNVGIGATSIDAKLHVKGSGTTSATTALLVEDSLGTDLLKVTDEGSAYINGSRTFTNSNNNGQLTFNNAFTDDNASNNTSFALVDIDYTWGEKYIMSGSYVNDIRITPNFDGQVSGNQDLSNYVSIYIKPTFGSDLRNVTYKGIYLDTPTFNQAVSETYHPLYITSGNSYFGGSVGIGATSPDASAKFQIDSTTQGALLPRMTTTERDAISSPATGLLIFNTTTVKLEYYSGSAWGQV